MNRYFPKLGRCVVLKRKCLALVCFDKRYHRVPALCFRRSAVFTCRINCWYLSWISVALTKRRALQIQNGGERCCAKHFSSKAASANFHKSLPATAKRVSLSFYIANCVYQAESMLKKTPARAHHQQQEVDKRKPGICVTAFFRADLHVF